jgi:hypothetical protein
MTYPFPQFGKPIMNQKETRIVKLYKKGMRRPTDIAKKIGYNSGTMEDGVACVIETLAKAGIRVKTYEAKDAAKSASPDEVNGADSGDGDAAPSAADRVEAGTCS